MSNFHTAAHFMFKKLKDISTQNVPYDYHSIMHFISKLHPVTGEPTIVSLMAGLNASDLGSALLPTEYDYLHINLLYCEGEQRD